MGRMKACDADWGTVHAIGQTNLAGEEADGKASLEVKGQKDGVQQERKYRVFFLFSPIKLLIFKLY